MHDGNNSTTSYQYDALGNQIQTTMPDGQQINYLYYGSGHLHQINLDGQVITDIERDDLHRQVARRQGQLTSYFENSDFLLERRGILRYFSRQFVPVRGTHSWDYG